LCYDTAMNKTIKHSSKSIFEDVKRVDRGGVEYWFARDFQKILKYATWNKFLSVIVKAKEVCRNSRHGVDDHFSHMGKMVTIGSGAMRETDDIRLSRYACYLIVQNADPAKEIVALGQTYFAAQTRRQELSDEFRKLKTADEKRLFLREQMRGHNKQLASTAKGAGVITPLDYAIFQDHGYKGLYDGLSQKRISTRIKASRKGRRCLII
jgi:DNA-damage-inducible protein D